MTSLERVTARMAGQPVDKIPNLNITMGLVAKCAGVSYRAYVQDYRHLVAGNLICAERYGMDTLSAISDPMREASAFGAGVVFPENGVPHSEPPLLAEPDLSRLHRFDPLKSERTLDRIRAVEALRQKGGRDYPVIGWVEGALAEAADLRSVRSLMKDLHTGAPFLEELFEIIFEQQCRFALEQIKAGADFIGIGNAVASLVGPVTYEKYALKYDKAIVDFVRENGAKSKLHICGNTTALLPLMLKVRPDIFDVDWMVDWATAVKNFEGTPVCVNGNIDPVAVLLQGEVDDVRQAVAGCVAAAGPTGLIAAGCEVPADTPKENLLAMDKALYLN